MALVQKAFSDIITFSRSSNATRVGPTGLVEYAPHNLLTYSEQFDNAAWGKGDTTITANAIAAPNGTITADKLNETATTTNHQLYSSILTSAQSYTWSIYARASERTVFSLGFSGSTIRFAWFDLSSGTLVSATNCTATITNVGNSWYRCTLTATAAAETTYPQIFLGTTASGYAPSYAGTAGSGIYLWGAQLSVGPYALDYTPTTSAAVYGPRFDYDGSGVTIVEPVSRNLLTYSEQFDNAAWNMINGTVTANSIAAPDGTITADKYTPSATNSYQLLYQTAATFGTYTFSVYAKAGEYTQAMFWTDKPVAFGTSAFNLSNGTVFQQGTGHTNVSITSVGNGWYRCSITATSTSGTPNFYVGIAPSGNTGGTFAGNGTSGAYLWGAQLEVGSTATAYMVSGATNGFRAVPVVSGSATPKGLLIEESRTNLVTYSEDISNADWINSAITVSANFGTSPDGTVNADKMVGKSSYSGTSWLLQVESLSASTIYTASVFLKRSGVRYAYVGTDNSANRCVFFDLQTGTVGNAATGYSGSIVAVGNDWYRCVVTINTSTASYAQQILIGQTDTANSVTYTGNNVDGILVWGAQLENNQFASSYIPTLASTVTRSADVASVNTLSPWFNATEGSFYIEANTLATSTGWFSLIQPQANTLPSDERLSLGITSSNANSFYALDNGSVVVNGITSGGSIFANRAVAKTAFRYKVNDYAISGNGAAIQTDTSATVPTIDKVLLGDDDQSRKLNGYLRRVSYYPRALSDAELQALTA